MSDCEHDYRIGVDAAVPGSAVLICIHCFEIGEKVIAPTPKVDVSQNRVGKHQRPGDASETQVVSAHKVAGKTGAQRQRVYDYLFERGEYGATDEEMQNALDMNPSTQRPRRVELVEMEVVADSEKRRRTKSGRMAVVWVIS